MHAPLLALLTVLGVEFTHAELGVRLELPAEWTFDRECGPFVPAAPRCRVDGKLAECPKSMCPERVGVLWVTAPTVLTSRDSEKAELLASDAGAAWVSSSQLPDGWVLTWGGSGDTFPFKVSRKIGARVIECSGEGLTIAGQQAMIDACKSLKVLR